MNWAIITMGIPIFDCPQLLSKLVLVRSWHKAEVSTHAKRRLLCDAKQTFWELTTALRRILLQNS